MSAQELYDQAVELLVREGRASTSVLQRHLVIGYATASRLIRRMESEDIVSPPNADGKRIVLLRPDEPPKVPKLEFKLRPAPPPVQPQAPREKRPGRITRLILWGLGLIYGAPTYETATSQRERERAYSPSPELKATIDAELQAIIGGPENRPAHQENPYAIDPEARARAQDDLDRYMGRGRYLQRPEEQYDLDDEMRERFRVELEESCADPPKKVRHKPQKVRRPKGPAAPVAPRKAFSLFGKLEDKSISHVSERNGTFTVYDERGRTIRQISTSPSAHLVGYTNKTFSIKFANTVTVYHVNGRIISQRSGG